MSASVARMMIIIIVVVVGDVVVVVDTITIVVVNVVVVVVIVITIHTKSIVEQIYSSFWGRRYLWAIQQFISGPDDIESCCIF